MLSKKARYDVKRISVWGFFMKLRIFVFASLNLLFITCTGGPSATGPMIPSGTYTLTSVTCSGDPATITGVSETYNISGGSETANISTGSSCSFSVSATLSYSGYNVTVTPGQGQNCSPNSSPCLDNCGTTPSPSTTYVYAINGSGATGSAGTTVTLTSTSSLNGLCPAGTTEVDTLTSS